MPSFVSDYTAMISNYTWSTVTGQTTVVTYSFDTEAPDYLLAQGYSQAFMDSFAPFSSQQETVTVQALNDWAAVSGVVFVEVAPGEGDIRLGNYDFDLDPDAGNAAGYAYFPSRSISDWGASESDLAGDVFIDHDYASNMSYYLIAHELGHAIGFEHSHDGDIQLTHESDIGANTVMSYNAAWGVTQLGAFDDDLAQYMYGANGGPDGSGNGLQSYVTNVAGAHTQITYGSANSEVIGSSLQDLIRAGAGGDTIAGYGGNDRLYGEAGDDILVGGPGDDRLYPGTGDDRLIGGDWWNDTDGGQDEANYSSATTGMRVYLQDSVWNGTAWANAFSAEIGNDTFYEIDDVTTGAGNDTVDGSTGDNRIKSGGGADTVSGGAGDDTLLGGKQDDTLDGGADSDWLYGGRGVDSMTGGTGADTLGGNRGNDLMDGGDGNDKVSGNEGRDLLSGGIGNDTLLGGDDKDTLNGGTGEDQLEGGDGNDVLNGGDNADVLMGGRDNDIVNGQGGDDLVYGNKGNDTLSGGVGDDTLHGDNGSDTFVFADGDGMDVIADFNALSSSEKIDLSGLTAASNLADVLGVAQQDGDDVVLTFDVNTVLRLEDVTLSDLDGSDFMF